MKRKKLLYSLLTVIAFVGCSNDDDLMNEEEQENGQLRYLAVNIVTPKGPGVRSATDGGFENGSEDEDAAEKATFVLLDGDDQVAEVILDQTLEPWRDLGDYEPNVENISTAVLVVKEQKTKPNIKGILAILNAPDGLTITKNTTLQQIKDIAGAYGTAGTKGSFIMTNSVYANQSNIKIAADVAENSFALTPDAAKNNPVNIYVERVVAKIRTNAVADITAQGGFNKGTSVLMDGETTETPLTINIKGIQIANCAQKSYLFKNVDNFTATDPWDGWNDPTNFRSYWANIPTGVTYDNHSWNEISNGNRPLTEDQKFYVQENVVLSSSTSNPKQHTSVIVTAQLNKKKEDGKEEPFEFVRIAGIYYTPDGGLTQIANSLAHRHYYIKVGDAYESIPATYLEWATSAPDLTDVKGWEGFAQLQQKYNNETFYQYVEEVNEGEDHYQKRKAEDINVALQEKALRALKWTNGMCYYFVDIEHFGTETNGDTSTPVQRKGIIRNHVYDLTLKSLTGLGVPVFDPNKDIIPENPPKDNLFYLAASINIHKWKIVSQTIEFNN